VAEDLHIQPLPARSAGFALAGMNDLLAPHTATNVAANRLGDIDCATLARFVQ
jgi:hypothetical protein